MLVDFVKHFVHMYKVLSSTLCADKCLLQAGLLQLSQIAPLPVSMADSILQIWHFRRIISFMSALHMTFARSGARFRASTAVICYLLVYCNCKSFDASLRLLSAVQIGNLESCADAKRWTSTNPRPLPMN